MEISLKEFRKRIKEDIWPFPGEPKNIVAAHNRAFREAMTDLSNEVKCLQQYNTSVFPACSTYVECGKTLFAAPNGIIRRVFTIANELWCNKVFYDYTSIAQIEAWSRNLVAEFVTPGNAGLPGLQQGIRFAEPATDSEFGRSYVGWWTRWRNRIYMAPWLQSNESAVIEWDGAKSDWGDDDLVDLDYWTTDAEKALKLYLQMAHERDFGDLERKRDLMREYESARADVMVRCEERRRAREEYTETPDDSRIPTSVDLDNDKPPTAASTAKDGPVANFANIGDFGQPTNGTAEADVAALVKSWDDGAGTFFITTNGDNIYAPTNTYAAAVGAFYGDYVREPFELTAFYPALGQHDYNDPVNGLTDFRSYFKTPNNGRYYDVVRGPTHWFFLNSSLSALGGTTPEPDTIDATGVQAMWLKAKLALSVARWKIVVVQDPPFTYGPDYPGHTVLRWPYKDWGADLVLSGDTHYYERFEVSGLPYIVNGSGGAALSGTENADAGGFLAPFKKALFRTDYGAIRGSATCDQLKLEFYRRTGALVDTLTLTK